MTESDILLQMLWLLYPTLQADRLQSEVLRDALLRLLRLGQQLHLGDPPPDSSEVFQLLGVLAPALRPAELPFESQRALLPLLFALGQARHPDDPDAETPVVVAPQRHAAFANSLYSALTGWSGGYGGPSMREHWAGRRLTSAGQPGEIPFDWLLQEAELICYGPLMLEAARMVAYEQCFDDPPGDSEEAVRLLEEAGEAHLLYDDDDWDLLADMDGMSAEDFPPENGI